MKLGSTGKHILHVLLFLTVILLFQVVTGAIPLLEFHVYSKDTVDPWSKYGTPLTIFLYAVRFMILLPLPLCIFQLMGLIMYNAFPEKVQLKGSPLLSPSICIRVVTRGDFPDLVKRNVQRNLNTCLDLGMDKFMIEVVTDKPINLERNPRVREIVVPSTYTTKRGSLFKARALQYCLEDDVNVLNGDDWIVHLDEETIMTDNAVRGILNFCMDGRHDFGQGLITYANETVVNWITTLADMFRVSDDMGKLRFQFKYFHKPLFSWKGSYVVTRCSSERKVTYDVGPAGSVAEDCYFAMIAYSQGFTFDFIEGEMWEKSPFNFWDLMMQRKRWIQGIYLVVNSKDVPLSAKCLLGIFLYSWLTIPLTTSNIILAAVWPIPVGTWFDILTCFIGAVQLYMYIFGVIKSFSAYRIGMFKFLVFVIGAICTIPLNIAIENIAVIWGLFGYKKKFYVVQKEYTQPMVV